MRDIAVTLAVFGLLPFVLKRPWIGILVWTWLGFMNPHRMAWGFSTTMPFAYIVALTTFASMLYHRVQIRIPWERGVRAVGADDVFRAHDALLPLHLARAVDQRHRDRPVAFGSDLEALEFEPVVGLHPGRRARHHAREIVEHARLVDEDVRVLADAAVVLGLARNPDDARRIRGVGLPEHRLRDLAALGDDLVGESERLEGLDAALLDAVGLADLEPSGAPLDDAGRDAGELRQLRRGDHPGGAGADDQHVDPVRDLVGPVDAGAGCRLDAWIAGNVTAMVELHVVLTRSAGRFEERAGPMPGRAQPGAAPSPAAFARSERPATIARVRRCAHPRGAHPRQPPPAIRVRPGVRIANGVTCGRASHPSRGHRPEPAFAPSASGVFRARDGDRHRIDRAARYRRGCDRGCAARAQRAALSRADPGLARAAAAVPARVRGRPRRSSPRPP